MDDLDVKLILPSVEPTKTTDDGAMGSNEYAESIILDEDEDENETFFLPRIEVNVLGNADKLNVNSARNANGSPTASATVGVGLPTWNGTLGNDDNLKFGSDFKSTTSRPPGLGLPTWNSDYESLLPLSRKPKREIIAENAHPKCFGFVGASGLSRVFTSGSFCPDLSSRSMVPKSLFKCSSVPSINITSKSVVSERTRPVERSKTIAHIPRSNKNEIKMPEITASKLSLFSRHGQRARNLAFVENARVDREKSDVDVKTKALPVRGATMPRIDERVTLTATKNQNNRIASKKPPRNEAAANSVIAESESDELTPSEAGIMGHKINDWFTTGRKMENRMPQIKNDARDSKKLNKNLWDPGFQRRIHRGLASSIHKSNACIGNYLNDVTASRFPQVEIRQIVFTR